MREARDRHRRQQEDDRQPGEQYVQRYLVRRLLPLGALDQADHAIKKGRALARGDAHLDLVGEHARAAGHRRAVAAALANDRGGFAGDRRFIDRGDTLDDLAIARDQVARLDEHDIADLQLVGRHVLPIRGIGGTEPLCDRLRLRAPQARRLRLAAAFGDRLGEIGEQHGEPQPEADLAREGRARADEEIAHEQNSRRRRDDLDDEHDRVAPQGARVELLEGIADRRPEDRRIEQRQGFGLRGHLTALPRTRSRPASRTARQAGRARRPGNRSGHQQSR